MTQAPEQVHVQLELRRGLYDLASATDRSILVEGPAGTGKTYAILSLINMWCHQYPRMRALITRKFEATLAKTCLQTFNEKVLLPLDGVVPYGGSKFEPAGYRYPNGSRILTGGMDNPGKVLSGEYDLIYANECTELKEEDLEILTTRLRHGVMPFQRFIGDCNPTYEKHYLNRRCAEGRMRRIVTTLKDNPAYYTREGEVTERGQDYLTMLNDLTGARRERFLLGKWTGAEHAIYPAFDRSIHVRDIPADIVWQQGAIGSDQGSVHKAGVVAIKVDQYGRRWVLEAWSEQDKEHGESVARQTGRLASKYNISRVRTDPTGAAIAAATSRLLGASSLVNAALGNPGTRLARIRMVNRLLQMFPGGRVFSTAEEQLNQGKVGPWQEPDSPGLILLKGAPGIDELCDQIEAYHFEPKETDVLYTEKPARVFDDLVAPMEYAIEELEDEQMFGHIVPGFVEDREQGSKGRPQPDPYQFTVTPKVEPPQGWRDGAEERSLGRG